MPDPKLWCGEHMEPYCPRHQPKESPMTRTPDQWRAIRARTYAVLVAAGPLAVFYGLATQEEVVLWLGVAGAALGNGLAHVNARRPRR